MYIHRIAIDKNHINARLSIPEMTALERYHDAQIIEIVKTSTLAADSQKDYDERRRQKAGRYRTIGSNAFIYMTNPGFPDAVPGATGTDSRMSEIFKIIFPELANNLAVRDPDDALYRARRDALHIDQAMQNAVDWFVTSDQKIIDAQPKLLAAGIDLRIGQAPAVLSAIENYFQSRYGTLDTAILRTKMMGDLRSHPVILGSNHVGISELTDPQTGEVLFFTRVVENRLGIGAVLRHASGERLVTIEPGVAPKFERPGPSLVMMVGESHLLIGERSCASFAVSFEGRTILEGRVARSGHIIICRGLFRSSTGAEIAEVNRESLTLHG